VILSVLTWNFSELKPSYMAEEVVDGAASTIHAAELKSFSLAINQGEKQRCSQDSPERSQHSCAHGEPIWAH
jgi:hypothetical protein